MSHTLAKRACWVPQVNWDHLLVKKNLIYIFSNIVYIHRITSFEDDSSLFMGEEEEKRRAIKGRSWSL